MTRRATIRTTHDDPALIARAIAPDNTAEMETTVDDGEGSDPSSDDAVVTRIERETTSGLQSTVDDYVVNLAVAIEVAQHAHPTDTGTVSDTPDNTKL
ncbi:KEOPS complex subunit Pcc1 [Natronococcus sp. A-GB1]|uniref:KEOPS complex subunit Pcc1 n=1 Tax=Natronococcus sp. A-GB1 TaxID=3037648 RepID=UPI00241E2626|nr:KEOPS complex subunit Pcc1 [Natronococcus sp. A-GB1]MDG5762022.1 KEOPS complex subunit Pcc1 [Natronococcus sp. A-GB1]